ncbi:hydrogenase maturation nickel metallochaperone HypA [Cyanobium sp. FACHB-13342]|uniref:hydrogenase maturation nickel metallochaperone HypA n=1 Tax=Cyanobium sp. FACHB-13342 TaxID=2692793 RepID=UPI00168152F2|nr:hydrogenase maturation nickel metallochaperone HypA [Cyanobium sp. FACHB-13342]MBD2422857.1 hydrogenase maturation nickel metallochaperone HypA [Cyanobium sp. FACHB-13342]
MHELSLMEAVRDQALAAAHADGAIRITVISLRVGELAGVELEALRFAFPVAMAGTIAAGAELRIESEPAECHCAACNAPFPAADGCCDCPRCGAISRQLLRGRDLRLLALEVV